VAYFYAALWQVFTPPLTGGFFGVEV